MSTPEKPDYFFDTSNDLFDLVLIQNRRMENLAGDAESLRQALDRWDEGTAAIEWVLTEASEAGEAGEGALVDPRLLCRMVAEISAYGGLGIRPEWLDRALARMKGEGC